MAAKNGHLEVCELIMKNIVVWVSQDNICTPLHYATFNESVEIYSLLSNHLTNKNPPLFNGNTPLHMAAQKGHLKLCKFIMDSVHNKNPGNSENCTPLHLAAKYGNKDVCELILKNVNNKQPQTLHGITPWKLASENYHYQLAVLLKAGGQDNVGGYWSNDG